MGKYFCEDAKGLKADLDRHRAREADLDAKIAEIEAIVEPTTLDVAVLNAYRNLRGRLLQSKAEVVSKIGKQK